MEQNLNSQKFLALSSVLSSDDVLIVRCSDRQISSLRQELASLLDRFVEDEDARRTFQVGRLQRVYMIGVRSLTGFCEEAR